MWALVSIPNTLFWDDDSESMLHPVHSSSSDTTASGTAGEYEGVHSHGSESAGKAGAKEAGGVLLANNCVFRPRGAVSYTHLTLPTTPYV